jgi:hypothetical protein
LLFGGPALFLAAQTWHRAILLGDLRPSRLVTLSALLIGCLTTTTAPAYLAAVVAAAIVVTLTAFERHHRPIDPSTSDDRAAQS